MWIMKRERKIIFILLIFVLLIALLINTINFFFLNNVLKYVFKRERKIIFRKFNWENMKSEDFVY